jgi:uncharacterized DUF497 family protein
VRFAWDPGKAATNATKHGTSFEEASTVFRDPLARILDDPVHSSLEHREIIVGHSAQTRLLVVSFTEREGVVRIITARLATKVEHRDHEEGND